VGSENPSGADNQQETVSPCIVLDPNWIVGFVDGEGCFSVSVHRNSMMHRHGGWQLQPVFHVFQHSDHREVLEAMVKQRDFDAFATIVRSMRLKEHLSGNGFERLVRLAYGMNANGKQRSRSIEQVLAGSSETVRGAL